MRSGRTGVLSNVRAKVYHPAPTKSRGHGVSIEQMFEIVTLGGLTSVTRTSAGQMSPARAPAAAGAGRRARKRAGRLGGDTGGQGPGAKRHDDEGEQGGHHTR